MLNADVVRAVGTMSGTSLDGVDVAVIETDGVTISGFGETAYKPYSNGERAVLRNELGRWPGDPGVAQAAEVVMEAHALALQKFTDVSIVGLHGQTLAHDPGGRGTHQVGDGAALANRLGLPVAWDFRSSDVAAGGQGAPLAPAYHFALARWIGAKAPLAILNLGGVGNLTWIDPTKPSAEAEGALLAFDTGPANAPLNDLMMQRMGKAFDSDSTLAGAGEVDEAILARFADDPWFDRAPPKSLDRNAFDYLEQLVAPLSNADAAATLTAVAADAVALGTRHFPAPVERVLVAGGGRHNPLMVSRLAKKLACEVIPIEAVGLDGDMLEAQAFGYLAVRVARGLPITFPGTTGVPAPMTGGRISRPQG